MGESVGEDTFYLDFERIRKYDGYVYYWTLADFSTPTKKGYFSAVHYWRGDCELFRLKNLAETGYRGQMAKGEILGTSNKEDIDWTYPNPNSPNEYILKVVCSR